MSNIDSRDESKYSPTLQQKRGSIDSKIMPLNLDPRVIDISKENLPYISQHIDPKLNWDCANCQHIKSERFTGGMATVECTLDTKCSVKVPKKPKFIDNNGIKILTDWGVTVKDPRSSFVIQGEAEAEAETRDRLRKAEDEMRKEEKRYQEQTLKEAKEKRLQEELDYIERIDSSPYA